MNKCDTVIVSGPGCDGHLGKFDSCLAEAIYEWSLDDADARTGDCDFEGHLTLVLIPQPTTTVVDPDGIAREVAVPAGNYLLWEAPSGAVSLGTTATPEQAREIFRETERRYDLWEHGCDPGDPAGHAECFDYDRCRNDA